MVKLAQQILVVINQKAKNTIPLQKLQVISLLIGLFWALSPIQLTSVLYIVQRMTSLSCLFTLCALVSYMAFRTTTVNSTKKYLCLILAGIIFFPLAILSKENAGLTPFYFVLLEVFIFQFRSPFKLERFLVVALKYTAIIVLIAITLWLLINPEWLANGYAGRNFSLSERVLTETRILLLYLYLCIVPDVSNMSLFHDDIVLSTSFINPVSTLFATLFLFGLIGLIFKLKNKYPVSALGLSIFLVGHSLESTIYPLELVHEHRNYFPSIGLWLAFYPLFVKAYTANAKKFLLFVSAIVFIFMLLSFSRVIRWTSEASLYDYELSKNPQSSRLNYSVGRLLIIAALENKDKPIAESHMKNALYYLNKSHQLSSDSIGPVIAKARLYNGLNKEIPDDVAQTLINSLSTKILNASNMGFLSAMLQCQINGICDYQKEFLKEVFSAISSNTSLSGDYKAMTYNDMAFLYLNWGEHDNAIQMISEAIKAAPQNKAIWDNALVYSAMNKERYRYDLLKKQYDNLFENNVK